MEMTNTELALPLLSLMLLTLLVWLRLFLQRVGYMNANKLDVEQLKAPTDVAALIPSEASSASNNFKNLLELPVLFYAVCLYLMLAGQVDSVMVGCAWGFVALRAIHSLIHCSYNRVMHRFIAYLLSSIVLWVMVVRAFLGAI